MRGGARHACESHHGLKQCVAACAHTRLPWVCAASVHAPMRMLQCLEPICPRLTSSAVTKACSLSHTPSLLLREQWQAECADVVEATARGQLHKLEGQAYAAHWVDWCGAQRGPDFQHADLACSMQPQDEAVAVLLSALQALGRARPAAALELLQQLMAGCLAAFLRTQHVAALKAACAQLGWRPLLRHLALLFERCTWSRDRCVAVCLLTGLAAAQPGDCCATYVVHAGVLGCGLPPQETPLGQQD